MWSQMTCLEAEWDLVSIDKVDVRKKLRRFTILLAPEMAFPNLVLTTSYLNLCMYTKKYGRPGRVNLSRTCEARMDEAPPGIGHGSP